MSAWIRLGEIELLPVSGGRLWIDGGNMFGVIPRMLWQQVAVPDEQHRILVETNCVLVRTGTSLGLIDTGYGSKAAEKIRNRYSMEPGLPLLRNLARCGVAPEDIDWLILSHLHFDHAGGATYRDPTGQLRPTFPRARHFVQQREWDDATGELPELAGAYFLDDFVPLLDAGQLERVEDAAEIVPGVSVALTGGHTRGHQMVVLHSEDSWAVYPGDLVPTAAHLETFWTLAYDQFPLTVRRLKPEIIHDIVSQHRIILFSHDPSTPAGLLNHAVDGKLEITTPWASR